MSAPFDLPGGRGTVYIIHGSSRPSVHNVNGWGPEPDTAAARALHSRRALERALHHGADLMAALGLPSAILDAIEAGVDALDGLDAYGMDREESGDAEPSLGWPERMMQSPASLCGSADLELDTSDYEEDDPGEAEPDHEDGGDAEPSLASPERHGSQLLWAQGTDLETEEEVADHDPNHVPWWVRPAHPRTEARADV